MQVGRSFLVSGQVLFIAFRKYMTSYGLQINDGGPPLEIIYRQMVEVICWRTDRGKCWRCLCIWKEKRKVHQEVFNRQASLANLEDVGRKAAIYPFVKQAGVCGVVGRWKTEWPRMWQLLSWNRIHRGFVWKRVFFAKVQDLHYFLNIVITFTQTNTGVFFLTGTPPKSSKLRKVNQG